MVGFFIGLVVGAIIGILVMAILIGGREADF